jgi:hypothetical protein
LGDERTDLSYRKKITLCQYTFFRVSSISNEIKVKVYLIGFFFGFSLEAILAFAIRSMQKAGWNSRRNEEATKKNGKHLQKQNRR